MARLKTPGSKARGGGTASHGGAGRALHVKVKPKMRHTASSHAWLSRQLNDPYVQASKRDGWRSRAAYKLIEIDDKYHILKPGQRILDLGAAPGGWSQVAVERVKAAVAAVAEPELDGDTTGQSDIKGVSDGKRTKTPGQVVAIDYLMFDPIQGVEILELDFTDATAEPRLTAMLRGGRADVVLSDMAAPTTGHTHTDHLRIMGLAEQAYVFAAEILTQGGTFLCKVFQGGSESELLKLLKRDFQTVRHIKPPASRAESAELYVLATGFRGGPTINPSPRQ
jgi:23S rRNA (uridine2552-2'-O)-methyltransferase